MARKAKVRLTKFDVRLRCVYDRPSGQQPYDDMTVMIEAEDAAQAIALAKKLGPAADKDGRGLLEVSVHGLDQRPLEDVVEDAA